VTAVADPEYRDMGQNGGLGLRPSGIAGGRVPTGGSEGEAPEAEVLMYFGILCDGYSVFLLILNVLST